MQRAVDDLYRARSAVVRSGDDSAEADMTLAREAYVRCFVELGRRLPSLRRGAAAPLGDLIGDP